MELIEILIIHVNLIKVIIKYYYTQKMLNNVVINAILVLEVLIIVNHVMILLIDLNYPLVFVKKVI